MTVNGDAVFESEVLGNDRVRLLHDVVLANESHVLDVSTTTIMRNEVTMLEDVVIGDSLDDEARIHADLVLGHCDANTNPCDITAGEDRKVVINAETGNTAIQGTLGVTGLTTVQAFNAQHTAAFDADVAIGNEATDALTVESTVSLNAKVTVADGPEPVDHHVVGAALVDGRFETTAINVLRRDTTIGTNLLDSLNVLSTATFDQEVLIERDLTVGLLSEDHLFKVRSDILVQDHLQATRITLEHVSGNVATQGTLTVTGLTTLQTLNISLRFEGPEKLQQPDRAVVSISCIMLTCNFLQVFT
eukprot:SAG31_NODE_2328_length_5934_cov_1.958355_4_plen_304_part_00